MNIKRQYKPVYISLILGILTSALIFVFVNRWERDKWIVEFESKSRAYANAVQKNLDSNLEALQVVRDFFGHSNTLERSQFSFFVNSILTRHPSIQAISWNPLVKHSERQQYEAQAQNEGFVNFQFRERSIDKKLIRARDRDEYVVVYYIEPLANNKAALGFDIASNSTRLEAITDGFNSGKIGATDRITLVQEKGTQAGILVLLPIFHQTDSHNERQTGQLSARRGFLVEVLRVGDVISSALEDFPEKEIDVYLYDLSATSHDNRLLHFSPSKFSTEKEFLAYEHIVSNENSWQRNFTFAGRKWQLVLHAPPNYIKSQRSWYAILILAGSLLLTFMYSQYIAKKISFSEQSFQVRGELKKSEDRFKTLFEKAPIGYQSLDKHGNFVEVNTTWLEQLGYTRDEVIGKSFGDFLHPDWRSHFKENFPKFKAIGEILDIEFEMMRKDGSMVLMTINGKIGTNPDGSFKQTHCVLHDITEQRAAQKEKELLEEQLRQSQKMEAVGTMAGGIAHDFNNILAIILGNAEFLKEDIDSDSDAMEYLEDLLEASHRAKKLVHQILAFSRKEEIELIIIEPQSFVKETMALLRSTTPATVKIIENISNECGAIKAAPTQLHQVVMNLFTNSVHAINEKGEINVRLEEVSLGNDDIENLGEVFSLKRIQPGSYVKLSVIDNGEGMSAETLERIFDPFFTTKDVGQGTGMGLSVVHGIVESHDGYIEVFSEIGKGSCFQIYFPIVEINERDEIRESKELRTGNERILLVDDEEQVLKLTHRILVSLGYEVTPVDSSLEAIECFRSNMDGFDLIITDQSMPNMSGVELIEEILVLKPSFPSIICSGYSSKISKDSFQEKGIKKYIRKPFSKKHLADAIREVLGED